MNTTSNNERTPDPAEFAAFMSKMHPDPAEFAEFVSKMHPEFKNPYDDPPPLVKQNLDFFREIGMSGKMPTRAAMAAMAAKMPKSNDKKQKPNDKKQKPNNPCLCGSGKKFKKCCAHKK